MRAAFVRNVIVAVANGIVTLAILLIAPLGLAAVVTNTMMVAGATFTICSAADVVVAWLLPSSQAELLSNASATGEPVESTELKRREQNQ